MNVYSSARNLAGKVKARDLMSFRWYCKPTVKILNGSSFLMSWFFKYR